MTYTAVQKNTTMGIMHVYIIQKCPKKKKHKNLIR